MCRYAESAIGEPHPHEDVSGDREQKYGRPDVKVKNVEPLRIRGRLSKRADPQRVEDEDQCRAAGSSSHACAPLHWVGEDGSEAQRQRISPTAGERDLDRHRRCAKETCGSRALSARHRQQHVRGKPVQTEQSEEAEAPRRGAQRKLNGSRRARRRVRLHAGSPAR